MNWLPYWCPILGLKQSLTGKEPMVSECMVVWILETESQDSCFCQHQTSLIACCSTNVVFQRPKCSLGLSIVMTF